MRTRLAIVGASVRAAAQSAVRAGFEVVGADLFADADFDGVCPITRVADYPHGLGDWLAGQETDGWMYTGALENYPDRVDQMATIAPLWGVSGEPLERCRDPLWIQYLFAREGVPFPLTLPRGIEPRDLVGGDANGWLAKTYRHAAGAGVWAYGAHPPGKEVFAQRIAQGRPHAAVFAITPSAATLLGVTEQLLEGYAYRGSVGPIAVGRPLEERLNQIGGLLRDDVGLRGLVGVDFVLSAGDAVVIEINPRFTASVEVLERAYAASAVGACFTPSKTPWPTAPASDGRYAKRVLFATARIDITPALSQDLHGLRDQGRVADVPRAGSVVNAGEPICTVFAAGASRDEALGALEELATSVLSRCAARG